MTYGKNTEEEIISKFWERVDKRSPSECWNWIGAIKPAGYGNFMIHRNIPINAHRMSWTIHNGPIPNKTSVLHKCDNRRCVNPNHLYLGTQSDNMSDRATRNPTQQGGYPGGYKLYKGEVWLIKKIYKSGKFAMGYISKMFKCSPSTIYRVIHNEIMGFKEEKQGGNK